MSIQSGKIEAGLVYLPAKAAWLAEMEAELFGFPNCRHDDQVDSISQALGFMAEYQSRSNASLEGMRRLVDNFGRGRSFVYKVIG